MIDRTAKKKIFFINSAVCLIALFIGTVFIYRPFILKKEELRSKIREETKRNLCLDLIKILKEHVDSYEKRLPERKSVSSLLDEVSKMASERGLEILSISPETAQDLGSFIKLPIRIEVNSTYHGLGLFLSQLESSKKFIKVENIELKRVEENIQDRKGDKIFKIRANMLISSIILKD